MKRRTLLIALAAIAVVTAIAVAGAEAGSAPSVTSTTPAAGATVTKLHRAAPASGVPSTPCIEVATTAT